MKITLCGSIAFIDEMQSVKKQLEALGYEVEIPDPEVKGKNGEVILSKDLYELRKNADGKNDWIWERNGEGMKSHLQKVAGTDAILVLNHHKNGINGYIGANTFLEMGLAFHLNKKIYLLHPIPEAAYEEEVRGMNPSILNGDLDAIGNL